MMSNEISRFQAARCVTHSYACDCREYQFNTMRDALKAIVFEVENFPVGGEYPIDGREPEELCIKIEKLCVSALFPWGVEQ